MMKAERPRTKSATIATGAHPRGSLRHMVRHPGTIIVCGKVLNLNALRRQMAEDFKDRYGIGGGQ